MKLSGNIFINGEWLDGTGDLWQSLNPYDETVLGSGNCVCHREVDYAVITAKAAFDKWSFLSYQTRKEYVLRFRDLLESHGEAFAELIAKESGKVLWECTQEVAAMIGKIDLSIQAYEERCAPKSFAFNDSIMNKTRYKAMGVMVVFGPFNLPGHLPNGHIVPALLAGNTVVFKPSLETPLVGEFMIRLWAEVGLPGGVISLLQGGSLIGKELVKHPFVDGILFTGSSAVGKSIHRSLGGSPHKMLALEMGGNNPLLVGNILHADNLASFAYHTIQSAFITSGQRCVCARRLILVRSSLSQSFVRCLIKMTESLLCGGWKDQPSPFMGPVISQNAGRFILGAYEDLLKQSGSKVLVEMNCTDGNQARLNPAIVDVTGIEKRKDEEIFGPLLQLILVDDFKEALFEANQTEYGLAAGLLSADEKEYEEFLFHSRAGIINYNRPTTGASGASPFGGVGSSGNFRPSGYFASDYCSYPVSSMESMDLELPEKLIPGVERIEL